MSGAETSPLAGRLTLKVGTGAAARSVGTVIGAEIGRDLRDVAGYFDLQLFDGGRAAAAMPQSAQPGASVAAIQQGAPCQLAIDGEPVLVGYIDVAEGEWRADRLQAHVRGRDRTGDLVDCAATPNGPAEFRHVDLLHIAGAICAPFGIRVVAQTEIGAPFERLAIGPHETAMVAIEKAARQRAVLLVSDGVGGLLLTTGGRSAAPGNLIVGQGVLGARYRYDWTRRFSDVFVKGQAEKAAGRRGSAPALTHATAPLANGVAPSLPADAEATEGAGILMVGHAVDPAMTRWRPSVRMTRTQSGMSSVQVQAEWWVRVLRGESTLLSYTVPDWRGPNGSLWRPNQVVRVFDPYGGVDEPMLIRKVIFRLGDDGARTEIEVVGLTAFDRINEAQRRAPLRAKYAPYPNQYTEFPTRPQ